MKGKEVEKGEMGEKKLIVVVSRWLTEIVRRFLDRQKTRISPEYSRFN